MALSHNERWEYNYILLQKFYTEYGCFPAAGVVYQGQNLGKWCANQKVLVKSGKCSADRLAKLQQCGLLDTTRDAKWEQHYVLMQKFLAEYQHFPKRDEVYEGIQLGVWYAEQKRQRNTVRYSADRLQKLMNIGIIKN